MCRLLRSSNCGHVRRVRRGVRCVLHRRVAVHHPHADADGNTLADPDANPHANAAPHTNANLVAECHRHTERNANPLAYTTADGCANALRRWVMSELGHSRVETRTLRTAGHSGEIRTPARLGIWERVPVRSSGEVQRSDVSSRTRRTHRLSLHPESVPSVGVAPRPFVCGR
jgi:hypothetical protein